MSEAHIMHHAILSVVPCRYLWGLLLPEERAGWDLFIMLLILWVVFATPMVVCFKQERSIWTGNVVAVLDLLVDLCFLLDIWLNFRTAYFDRQGRLVRSSCCTH